MKIDEQNHCFGEVSVWSGNMFCCTVFFINFLMMIRQNLIEFLYLHQWRI